MGGWLSEGIANDLSTLWHQSRIISNTGGCLRPQLLFKAPQSLQTCKRKPVSGCCMGTTLYLPYTMESLGGAEEPWGELRGLAVGHATGLRYLLATCPAMMFCFL